MPRKKVDKLKQIAKKREPITIVEEISPKDEPEQTSQPLFSSKEKEALEVVRYNMLWSMGISVIPIPLLDAVGTAGMQMKCLKELSDLYEIPFSQHRVKNIIASLLGGASTPYLATILFKTSVSFVPFIAPLAYLTSVPIVSGATTYAMGKVFIQHFESGGTFLDFDPQKVRDYYKQQFDEGLKVSSQLKQQKGSAS